MTSKAMPETGKVEIAIAPSIAGGFLKRERNEVITDTPEPE